MIKDSTFSLWEEKEMLKVIGQFDDTDLDPIEPEEKEEEPEEIEEEPEEIEEIEE